MKASDLPAFFENLAKNDAQRKQRKMVDLDVSEVSGVDHPAHLRSGWLVKKSVDQGHTHATDRHYLSEHETHTAEALHGAKDLKAGDSKSLGGDATLNREDCNCLSLTTPGTVAKAAQETRQNERQEQITKSADERYTEAERRYLLGDEK